MAVDVNIYKSDPAAAIKEIIRAKEVFDTKMSTGDKLGATSAANWANNVRNVSGVDNTLYGSGVNVATAKENYNKAFGIGDGNQYVPGQNLGGAPPQTVNTPVTNTVQQSSVPQTISTTQQPMSQPQSTPYTAPDMTSQINAYASAQSQSRIAQFDAAKQQALSNLNAEKASIEPQYYDKRNQAAAGSQQQARNFAEYMANRGGTSSGIAAQIEMSRGNALQGNLGQLNKDEAAAFADIERRRSDIENKSIYEQNAALADIAAQKSSQLINQANTNAGLELQAAGLTGDLKGNKTLSAKELEENIRNNAFNSALSEAGITGKYKGQDTMQGKAYNLQERQYIAESTGYDPETNMPTAAEKWRTKEYDATEAQRVIDNAYRDGVFDYQKSRDAVGDEQWAKQYKMQLDEFAWSKNPNNPTVFNAILQNKILDLQRQQLPKTQALELAKLSQDLKAGEVSISQAKAQIKNIEASTANIKANTANTNKSTALMGIKSGGGSRSSGGSSGGSSSGSGGSSGPGAESAHYGDTIGAINNYLTSKTSGGKDAKGNDIEPVERSSYMNDPYSVPYQRVVDIIANADITPAEKKTAATIYGIKPK